MKVSITYVGEAGTNVWGGVDRLPEVVFEKNRPVEIDTSKVPANHKGFYAHMIEKARGNRFFEVADVKGTGNKAAETLSAETPSAETPSAEKKVSAEKKASAKTLSTKTRKSGA